MRARVYIATTEGPALVRRLAPEEGLVEAGLSAVCLDGAPTRLPITGAYTYFVRDHVRGLSGRAAYRLDLDRRIDGGSSWMLGAWTAHLLLAEGRLALGDEAADAAVFATGEVALAADAERRAEVRAVGHVTEKVANLAGRAAEEARAGRRVFLIVPRDNAAEAEDALARLPERLRRGLAVHAVAGTGDVSRVMAPDGLDPLAPEGVSGLSGDRAGRRRGWLIAVLLLCLASAAAGAGYAAWRKAERGWLALRDGGRFVELAGALDAFPLPLAARTFRESLKRAAPAAAPAVTVAARRPADGGSCAGLRFRGGETINAPAPASGGVHRLDRLRSLCGFEVRTSAPEGALAVHGWIALRLTAPSEARPGLLPARRMVAGPLTQGPLRLSQELPLYLRDSWSWTLTAVWSPVGSADVTRLLRGGPERGAMLADLEPLGLSVVRARIELAP